MRVITNTATQTARRRPRGHLGDRIAVRPTRSGTTVQPLHEALAVGLGCTATGYRMSTPAEWR